MAGKEYQMAFTLGAKLQSQFGQAFRNAATDVSGLEKQIAALNKTGADIASYQKQKSAVESVVSVKVRLTVDGNKAVYTREAKFTKGMIPVKEYASFRAQVNLLKDDAYRRIVVKK